MAATAGRGSDAERDCLRALLSKQLIPLVLLVVFGLVIYAKAAELDFFGIAQAIHAIAPLNWTIAILTACLSFWAIGRMDVVIHRLIGTGVSPLTAQLSGIASVATAQLTGFGLLTGTLARWRVLPDISLWKAAQITGAVSASFMMALGILTSIMVLLAAPDLPFARIVALIVILVCAGLVAGSVWRPRALMRVNLPPLRAQATLVGLAMLDTGAAALTLYVLIPEAHMPPAALFYAVFLLALGAGLLGTTPGGVGPFEMMFLFCLPNLPEAPMLAAIVGYRLVYFALPAGLAVVLLIAGPAIARPARAQTTTLRTSPSAAVQPVATAALSFNARRAEAGLMRQGEFDLLCDAHGRAHSLVSAAGQSLIMLSDPLGTDHDPENLLLHLQNAATQRYLTPCIYKCGARTALVARNAGWRVLRVAQEAHVVPAEFDVSIAACRQLRRNLRKAQNAGLCVSEAAANLPLEDMRNVAQDWALHRKGARGFSMGQFDESYVAGQRVFLARLHGQLVAFITLHEAWGERTLDLMCQRKDAPNGAIHMLVTAAIEAAAQDRIARFSLAAVPCLSEARALPRFLSDRVEQMTGAAGLIRFKSGFAPNWEPLYLAAPGPVGLMFAGLDLVDRITRPRANLPQIHNHY